MVKIKQKNASQFRAKKSLFKIFKEMKSLYFRRLRAFFNQYTTPKKTRLKSFLRAFKFLDTILLLHYLKLHPAHV